MADPGVVNLDAQVIVGWMVGGQRQQRRTVAEADVQHDRRTPTELEIQIKGALPERDAEARYQVSQRALLRRRRPPGALHEASDRSMVGLGHGWSFPVASYDNGARAMSLEILLVDTCG